jgi:hypothetical protein
LKVTVMVRLPFEVGLAVEIQHVLDAVDLLLDRRGDGIGDGLRGAPGYCVVTTTVGGTTCGYSETGSVV